MPPYKIKMLKSAPGVNDGDVYHTDYEKGKTYTVGPDLGKAFIDNGDAEDTEAKKKEAAAKKKAEAEAKKKAEAEAKKKKADAEAKKKADAAAKKKAQAGAK